MKNKEMEELLNMLKKEDDYWSEKKHDYPFPDYYSLNREDLHLLLSHIEQLQTTANKCKQLENNRDKAIEYIERLDKDYDINVYQEDKHWAYILYILKGGSDE